MDCQQQSWGGGGCWLLVKYSPKILSPCTRGLTEAKVSAFIDQEHRTQKEDLLDANLQNFEVDIIEKIPLCHIDQLDTLTWPFNPMGEYILKLGYTFLQQEYQNSQPGQSDPEYLKPLWKAIWSLQVLSKLKKFCLSRSNNSRKQLSLFVKLWPHSKRHTVPCLLLFKNTLLSCLQAL